MLELNEPWIERPRLQKWSYLLVDAVGAGERPNISAEKASLAPSGYVELMQKCWAQAPNDRPDFGAVFYQLQNMSQSNPPPSPAAPTPQVLGLQNPLHSRDLQHTITRHPTLVDKCLRVCLCQKALRAVISELAERRQMLTEELHKLQHQLQSSLLVAGPPSVERGPAPGQAPGAPATDATFRQHDSLSAAMIDTTTTPLGAGTGAVQLVANSTDGVRADFLLDKVQLTVTDAVGQSAASVNCLLELVEIGGNADGQGKVSDDLFTASLQQTGGPDGSTPGSFQGMK